MSGTRVSTGHAMYTHVRPWPPGMQLHGRQYHVHGSHTARFMLQPSTTEMQAELALVAIADATAWLLPTVCAPCLSRLFVSLGAGLECAAVLVSALLHPRLLLQCCCAAGMLCDSWSCWLDSQCGEQVAAVGSHRNQEGARLHLQQYCIMLQ